LQARSRAVRNRGVGGAPMAMRSTLRRLDVWWIYPALSGSAQASP